MTERPGETQLPHLFEPVTWAGLAIKNRIKYGACCVSNYNTRDGFITRARARADQGDRRHRLRHHHQPGRLSRPARRGQGLFPPGRPLRRQVPPAVREDRRLHPRRRRRSQSSRSCMPDAMAASISATASSPRSCRRRCRISARRARSRRSRSAKPSSSTPRRRSARSRPASTAPRSPASWATCWPPSIRSSPISRTDEYGGSIDNRGRFMRELIDAIKQATPDHPLVVRLNGAELMDRWGGNDEDECFELMQQAADVRRRHDQRHRRLAGGARTPRSAATCRPAIGTSSRRGRRSCCPTRRSPSACVCPIRSWPNDCLARGAIRFLGGVPSAAGRPGAGAQGGGGAAGRGQALRRLAQLPVAAVSRSALYLHDEPGAGPRGRARVPDHAGRGAEEDHDHRRRSRGHGMRHRRHPARASM